MKLLSARAIRALHERALKLGGLPGESTDRPLDAVIGRVENAYLYGQIANELELAAWYGFSIAVGHPFNDANKRTAWLSLAICLEINGIEFEPEPVVSEQWMVRLANGELDIAQLTLELRNAVQDQKPT